MIFVKTDGNALDIFNRACLLNASPETIWKAWKAQQITLGDVLDYQQQHGIYFDQNGGTHDAQL